MKSTKYSEEIKEKIKLLYYQENRINMAAEKIYQKIILLQIGKCLICGHALYIGASCPNILPSGNVLPENPSNEQLIHYNSWHNNFLKSCQERDNTYIIERNKTPEMRESSRKVGLITGSINIKKAHEKSSGIKFCEKCKKETSHLIGVGCLVCHNNSNIMRETTSKRNLKNWKNLEYSKRIAKNLGIVQNFIYESPNCNKHKNETKMFYDKATEDYICWECYKEQFIEQNININFINYINQDYSNAFIQTTFRKQNSDNWSNAKLAFEKNIVEKEIKYMVYIKFYIDINKNVKPLVVGKTGSLLVNFSGTDVCFSTDISHGPARYFLYENNLKWDKTKILIISCETEEKALDVEKGIQIKYNLFES